MLSRMYDPSEERNDPKNGTGKLVKAFAEFFPEELVAAKLSAGARKRAARKQGIQAPPGMALGELKLLPISRSMGAAVLQVGGKIVRALHYLHTGRIVPKTAALEVNVVPNTRPLPFSDEELAGLAPGIPLVKWQRVELHDQFTYRYGTAPGGDLGAYVMLFRQSFSLVGLLSFQPGDLIGEAAGEDS